jgi:hypothetical protein
MLHPIVSLSRHNARVTFFVASKAPKPGNAGSYAGALNAVTGNRRAFRSQDEAVSYLRFWCADPSTLAELKWLYQAVGSSMTTLRSGTDGWLWGLAAYLVSAELVVMEETIRGARLGRVTAPFAATAAALASALDDLPLLSELPALPVTPDFLPIVESIQIEGAQVTPDVDSALSQISLAIGGVGDASVSLTPVPDNISSVNDLLSQVGEQANKKLDDG